jgi:hypothetical protein
MVPAKLHRATNMIDGSTAKVNTREGSGAISFGDKLVEMDRSSYSRMRRGRSSFDFINKKNYSRETEWQLIHLCHPRTKQESLEISTGYEQTNPND